MAICPLGIELNDVPDTKNVKGRVGRSLLQQWWGVEERGRAWENEKGYREGRQAPDLLLELIYHLAPSQNLTKSGLWTTPN